MRNHLFKKLCEYSETVFACGVRSVHGVAHWKRVDDSVQLICKETAADLMVCRFFAYLHDTCRFDDGADPKHGPRSADNLVNLPKGLAVLDSKQMELLDFAIRHHTFGEVSDDITIGACWDADRIDLGRVGIIPTDRYMSTEPGKEIARLGSKIAYIERETL